MAVVDELDASDNVRGEVASVVQDVIFVDADVNVNASDNVIGDDTNTTSNANSFPSTKRVGRKRSPVWDEFVTIDASVSKDGKARSLCSHCKITSFIACSRNGTKNMIDHLKKCIPYKLFLTTGAKGRQYDHAMYRKLVAFAIIKHGYAFSWVEHEGNRNIHTYLNNQVRTICRNTAKADCLKLHQSLMVDLVKTLKNVPGRICLTSDMWTSCQTEGYLCLTAHFVDENWKLSSRVLNFCHIDAPHTGYEMYSVVSKLIKDWGIEKKIFSITLDNASSNDKMQDYLKDSLNARGLLLNQGKFLHVRCAAHVLNLIVQDGLLMIQNTIRNIRLSVKYVKGSEVRKKSFKQCVELSSITETKALWLDVPTRWNSTFMMLDRAILYRNAFEELNKKDPLYNHCPASDDWEKIVKVRDVLEPFCDITNLFSGSDYPTSNLYFENVWRIAMLLRDLRRGEDEELRLMGLKMQEKFDKYWFRSDSDDYSTLFAFALILDPRFKKQSLKYCYLAIFEDEAKASLELNGVLFKLEKLLSEYNPKETTTNMSQPPVGPKSGNNKRKYDLVDVEYDEHLESTSLMENKLDLYLSEPRLNKKNPLSILGFWKENEKKYGGLSHLARDILTVPLTTVASESTFSIGGRILNKWRSSYLPENIEALITSRSWLYGYDVAGEDEEFMGSDVDWNIPT